MANPEQYFDSIVFEQAEDGGWGAYVPELPGLGVIGDTREEADRLIREGIAFHLEGLEEFGYAPC